MTWSWHQGKNLTYLTIPRWEAAGLQIGFSTRWGGVSPAPYASLNLGLHVGDEPDKVRLNRDLWFQEWGAAPSQVVVGEQVHGPESIKFRKRTGDGAASPWIVRLPVSMACIPWSTAA